MEASRTLCASLPAIRNPSSFAAALVWIPAGRDRQVRELRSVPPPLLRRTRTSLSAGDPPAGHGGEGFVVEGALRRAFETAMKRVLDAIAGARMRSQGGFPPSTLGSSDAGAFRRPCSDPVRIRRRRLAARREVAFWTGLLAEEGQSDGLVPPFSAEWVFDVNQMGGRSDSIPLELAFEHRFSRWSTMVCHRCR